MLCRCCDECKSWSVEAMQEHLKYQRSLAGKRGSKKSAVTAASVSQPAVASSPVVSSSPSVSASVSEDARLKDAVLAVLQSLSGSFGFNQTSTAPSTVPDSAPSVGGATGGVVSMKLHNVDSRFESSGVGALDDPAKSTSPVVLSENYNVLQSSARHYVGLGTVFAAEFAASVGHSPSPLGSSGADQLRVPGLGPLPSSSSSSSLSPNSLLFPLTPSPSLPPSSSWIFSFLCFVCFFSSFFFFLLCFFFLSFCSSSSYSFLHPCPQLLFLLPLWLRLLFLLPFRLFFSLPLPLPSSPFLFFYLLSFLSFFLFLCFSFICPRLPSFFFLYTVLLLFFYSPHSCSFGPLFFLFSPSCRTSSSCSFLFFFFLSCLCSCPFGSGGPPGVFIGFVIRLSIFGSLVFDIGR